MTGSMESKSRHRSLEIPPRITNHVIEEERGREQCQEASTIFSSFMEELWSRLEDLKDVSEDRAFSHEKYEKLIHNIHSAIIGYLEARRVHLGIVRDRAWRLRNQDTAEESAILPSRKMAISRDKKAIEEADQRRRIAHNALIDSIHIAARNIVRPTVETHGSLGPRFSPILDDRDPNHREHVAIAIIDYTLEQIKKQKYGDRNDV